MSMSLAGKTHRKSSATYQIVIALLSICSASSSIAASKTSSDLEEVLSMSLETLLSINVVSKQDESVINSPGIVSTYYRKHLQNLGLHNLRDFLHFVPGVEINETMTGTTLVQIRGLPNKTNQKVLFLLDDVPYWMPATGDFPTLGLPLEGIEKIEIIRGPGSVIYGTNASAGIIKVVTRQDDKSSINGYVNQDSLFNLSYFKGHKISEEVYINVSAEIQRDDGYSYEVNNASAIAPVPPYPNTDNGSLTRSEEIDSVMMNWQWENLSGIFQAFSSERSGDNAGSISSPAMYETRGTLVGLNYKHRIESGELDFYIDYNRYYRQVDIDNLLVFYAIPGSGAIEFENSGKDNDRLRAGISLKYELSKELIVLSGIEYEDRSTENQEFRDDVGGANVVQLNQPPINGSFVIQSDGSILLIGADQAYEKSAYVQVDYQENKWRLVTGMRYVNNSLSSSNISPRLSMVYSLSEKESIKLLYSEGFNSPTFGQNSGANILGVLQSSSIDAETIRTWDLAYTHTQKYFHNVANLFYTEAHDLILRDINGSWNSDDVIRRSGIEYDFQYRNNGLAIYSGVTYIKQGDIDSARDPDALFVSKWLAKLGANYSYSKHLFGSSLRFASERANVSEYYWLNVHYRHTVNSSLQIYSTIHNVLDDDIFTPDVKNTTTLKYQGANGRSLFLGLQYNFD